MKTIDEVQKAYAESGYAHIPGTVEICPECDCEVDLASVFEPQMCPSCGKFILPCSICRDAYPDELFCYECPLDAWRNELENELIRKQNEN